MSEHDETAEAVAQPAPPSGRRWRVLAAIVVVLVGGAIAAYFILRESTTPVEVEEAVADFRAATETIARDDIATSPAVTAAVSTELVAGSSWPEPGVYTYATTGRESIDALDGRNHDFPAETTITVTRQGRCAVHQWRPLQERWDETVLCPSLDGQQIRLYRSTHSFFGISDTRDFDCEAGSLWYPATTEPGYTWSTRCGTGDIDVERTGTIVGVGAVDVGGTQVEVLTYELHDEISGASNGINDRTVQVIADTGLIVGLAVVVDVQNDSPIGDVHYEERYELRLTSLDPLR
jgi:hypothetical protein